MSCTWPRDVTWEFVPPQPRRKPLVKSLSLIWTPPQLFLQYITLFHLSSWYIYVFINEHYADLQCVCRHSTNASCVLCSVSYHGFTIWLLWIMIEKDAQISSKSTPQPLITHGIETRTCKPAQTPECSVCQKLHTCIPGELDRTWTVHGIARELWLKHWQTSLTTLRPFVNAQEQTIYLFVLKRYTEKAWQYTMIFPEAVSLLYTNNLARACNFAGDTKKYCDLENSNTIPDDALLYTAMN